MTLKEGSNMKWNWTLDKVLMGVLIFLAVKTYNSMDEAVKKVNSLDGRIQIIEYRLGVIQAVDRTKP